MTDVDQQPQSISVDSLDTFVSLLSAWHKTKVDTLQHMQKIPEGTEVQVGEDKLILTGDTLKGFSLGIELGLMELGILPFYSEGSEAESETVAA